MKKLRAMLCPVAVLLVLSMLALWNVTVQAIAYFGFIWDVLLGAALGISLALLPTFCGFGARKNASVSMFWVCGFAALLLIFVQYMSLVTDLALPDLPFLSSSYNGRILVVEGALLVYCSVVAGRGKL